MVLSIGICRQNLRSGKHVWRRMYLRRKYREGSETTIGKRCSLCGEILRLHRNPRGHHWEQARA